MMLTRREFITKSMQVISLGAVVPMVFQKGTFLSLVERAAIAPLDKRTLVIIQMAGGNDGLNTVVPYARGSYYDLRRVLGVKQDTVLPLNEEFGFHPALSKFKALWDLGAMAVVQGVGYPKQSYSHFQSMRIWQTADPAEKGSEGWLGKYFDDLHGSTGSGIGGLSVGASLPQALASPKVPVPAIQSVESYRIQPPSFPALAKGRTDTLLKVYAAARAASSPYAALFDSTLVEAYQSSQSLQAAHQAYSPMVEYPKTPFARGLQILAEAITQGVGLRVGHVTIGGFDTHANQTADHKRLLTALDEGLYAFYQDLVAHGKTQDVLIMSWSEFGRRAKENGSEGTDHGSAAPLFLIGAPVKKGLYGEHPSLTNLDYGNLRFTTDFRSVYASVLEGWLKAPSREILGGSFPLLPFLNPA